MTHKNSGDPQHYPAQKFPSHPPPPPKKKKIFIFLKTSEIILIQNTDAQIMAKPMCTYKYQSTPQTCVYVYWWWLARENGVEALRNYVWLRYHICLCLEN